ncbi:hypothetical protein [Cupriavidus sp. D39]|uniref:hypothetical protein n=1 Tax=Cupriavidus sp. D39 TaxID=2997877 RepID=UPI00226FD088|nr:hypothetical protein [Cupriavidus sp. D39]MCY0856382.1 hypothetical protein [Cupriavidus sp. D39]
MTQVFYRGFPSHERTVFSVVCRRYGFIADDFDVSAIEGVGAGAERTPRIVTVELKTTRMSMRYAGDAGNFWPAEFEHDLSSDIFGPAPD